MDIHLNLCARKLIELVPRPTFFFFHFAPYTEIPRCRIKVGDRTIMENGKLKCECLPGWQTPLSANSFFFLAAIGSFE
jgi:hypothetical protein